MIKNIIVKFVLCWLILICVFAISVISVSFIPRVSITENVNESASTFEQEGLYPVSFGNKYSSLSFLGRDQYTDCLMINLAVSSESDQALKDAILNPCYKGEYQIEEWPDNLRKLADGQLQPDTNYDWYWHGYLVVLKPLMLIFNYNQIRWFNCILMGILFVIFLSLIRKRLGNASVLVTLGIVLLMHGETIPYTMQYASVFFVALIFSILLLKFKSYFAKDNNDCLAFFVIGAVTVYLDFLTTPIVTLGIPVIFWLLSDASEHKWKKVIMLSIMWGLGYALFWISKWGLCALTFDSSVLENAVAHADKWSGNDITHGRLFMTVGVVKKYLALIWAMNWIWAILVAAVGMCVLPKCKNWFKDNAWLLLVALMPFAWSLVLVNHNYEHFGFTWRNISVALLAIGMWFYKCVDWKKLVK